MTTRVFLCAMVSVLLFVGVSAAQHPLLVKIANKVVQKYQQSTCEPLQQEEAQKKGQPKPAMEQKAIQMLRGDPQLSAEFINRVTAPVANCSALQTVARGLANKAHFRLTFGSWPVLVTSGGSPQLFQCGGHPTHPRCGGRTEPRKEMRHFPL